MKCPKCGKQNPTAAITCSSCGALLREYKDIEEQATLTNYASFGQRLVAYILDNLIISVPLGCIMIFVFGAGVAIAEELGSEGIISLLVLLIQFVWLGVSWLYFSLFQSGPKMATPGKMAMGIVVTNISGKRITWANATGRFFAKILSGMAFCIGYILAAFTEKKQALHDILAGTIVLNKFEK